MHRLRCFGIFDFVAVEDIYVCGIHILLNVPLVFLLQVF